VREIVNALTIDVEDWFDGLELDPTACRSFQPRLVVGLEALLSLLDSEGVRATFFVLGAAAERHPDLVRGIADARHEIGTHGFSHRFVYDLTESDFEREVRGSIDLLEEVSDVKVLGHRAPFFSITRQCWWAFDILARVGIHYDSSIFPVHNYRYGIPGAPRFPFRVKANGASVAEFPISTFRLGRTNVPFSGGFYLRFWPYPLLRWAISRLNARGRPVVVYLHPWELDPDHPRIALPRRISVTHYHNLHSTWGKLVRLVRDFRFAPMEDVLNGTTVARTD
jgi:polysaccharide deacetylase family protein (PEP-CTERM system associated)